MVSQVVAQDGTIGVFDATKFSGLSRSTLYRLMELGRLRFTKIGRRRLVFRSELKRMLTEGVPSPLDGSAVAVTAS